MKLHLKNDLKISDESDPQSLNVILSLEPFIRFVKAKVEIGSHNIGFLKDCLQRLENLLQGRYLVSETDTEVLNEALEWVFILSSSPLVDEHTYLWGIGIPFMQQVIYTTDALDSLLAQTLEPTIKTSRNAYSVDLGSFDAIRQWAIYSFFLKKQYGFNLFAPDEIIYSIKPGKEDYDLYYSVNIDNRFMDIDYDGPLPRLQSETLDLGNISRKETLNLLRKTFPLEHITVKGIALFNVQDVTHTQLVEKLKGLLVSPDTAFASHKEIADVFKGILGNYDLDIILLPILEFNSQIITDLWEGTNEDLEVVLRKYQLSKDKFKAVLREFSEHPRVIYHHNLQKSGNTQLVSVKLLMNCSIKGIIINPVYAHGKLVGAIALLSGKENAINEHTLARLEDTIPLMEKVFDASINNYNAQLDSVIKNKFTSLQPAVEWKFNQVAIQYLRDKHTDKHPQLQPIHFAGVSPIYGAIDIQNSTLERNRAHNEDYRSQLKLLVEVLSTINRFQRIEIIGELIFRVQAWMQILDRALTSDDDLKLNQFLEKDIHPFILQLSGLSKDTGEMVNRYFEAIKPDGECHKNSRDIEKTFKILNSSIASLLDQMNDRIQEIYPCYFERYRTDGLEYNIYIGQSITPDIPYSDIYLKNLQLWQVSTMAVIGKNTEEIQHQLPRPLRTTQLIFVYPNTIDISFRNDEHRFDVEGSYNIRYEIVKKRIDKATVTGTGERLTQPGKIAIVYIVRNDVEEYLTHIKYLQERGILAPGIEELDIEALQGVSGLKAIRVSIQRKKQLSVPDEHNYLKETADLVQHKNES